MTGVAKKKSDSKTKKPEVMEQIHDAEEYPIEEDKDLMNASYTICATLHGGNDQNDRDSTVTICKQGKVQTLVATSVVARELFCQTTMRTTCTGWGSTGRAGNQGFSYTFNNRAGLVQEGDYECAVLSESLVKQELRDLFTKYKLRIESESKKVQSGGGRSG